MRLALPLVVVLLALPRAVAAQPAAPASAAAPLRLHLVCQTYGRTKACPAFLRGFVDATALLHDAPRAAADVVLYVNATELASTDRVHLRFVGEVAGAPPVVEAMALVDTRADDDTQRGQLRAAFLRGVALYVAARHPEAVAVELAAPAVAVVPAATTPWGFGVTLGGYGSYTEAFRSFEGWSSIDVSRIEPRSKVSASIGASAGVQRQPPLVIDGEEISLDSDQYALFASAAAARHLSDHWAIGGSLSALREDPEGQFRLHLGADGGIAWDRFHADDPRGNKLAVAYLIGVDVDRYNVRNDLGERRATYPSHALSATASVRQDKIRYGLHLEAWAEMVRPGRRHRLTASPSVGLTLGDHVDLSLSVSATQRALPGPAELDAGDFEQVTRASYAEPFSLSGSVNLRLHWDRTNGARNDRFGGG